MARTIDINITGVAGLRRLMRDAGFDESKHPRAENGQFGSGGGSSSRVSEQDRSNARALGLSDAQIDKLDTERAKLTEKFGEIEDRATREAVDSYRRVPFKGQNPYLGDEYNNRAKLVESLAESTKLPENITTYRGIRGDYADKVLNTPDGSVVEFGGLTSTSASELISRTHLRGDEQGVMLQLSNPKGSSGAFISQDGLENEILLPASAKFKVVGREGRALHLERIV